MIDKFLYRLLNKLDLNTIKGEQIARDYEQNVDMGENRFVPLDMVKWEAENILEMIRVEECQNRISKTPIKKFLFIEDGSVDIDDLIQDIENKNPEIKVVIYRQGAQPPLLKDIGVNNEDNN